MALDLRGIGTLLTAATAVVGTVFGLFGAVLQELAPPSRSMAPTLYAGIASLAALMVLLVIVLVMPARLSRRQRQWIVPGVTGFIGLLAVAALLTYMATLQSYVFRYPDSGEPISDQPAQRYIRGEYTALGLALTGHMSITAAVDSVGGIRMALRNQLLWTEKSRQAVEMRLVLHYVVSIALVTMALFGLAVAVIRSARKAGERPDKTA